MQRNPRVLRNALPLLFSRRHRRPSELPVRLMVATGLHQVPHPELTYYWRLKDHGAFLREIGVVFDRCAPRMSRDFLVTFADPAAAVAGVARLSWCVAADGLRLFAVDNRGTSLFLTLTYSRGIDAGFTFSIRERSCAGLDQKVAFVAFRNGEHDGIRYFVDTAIGRAEGRGEILLADLPGCIAAVFGLKFPSVAREPAWAEVPAA